MDPPPSYNEAVSQGGNYIRSPANPMNGIESKVT